MGRSIRDLPSELLLLILNDCPTESLAKASVVCRQWSILCKPFVFRDILIARNAKRLFHEGQRFPLHLLQHVASIAVALPSFTREDFVRCQYQSRSMHSVSIRTGTANFLTEIATILQSSTNLKHFSLNIDVSVCHWDLKYGYEPCVNFEQLQSMLATLPKENLSTLKLDLTGIQCGNDAFASEHLCVLLSDSKFPNLRHLSYRSAIVCDSVLDSIDEQNFPLLKSVSMDLRFKYGDGLFLTIQGPRCCTGEKEHTWTRRLGESAQRALQRLDSLESVEIYKPCATRAAFTRLDSSTDDKVDLCDETVVACKANEKGLLIP